MYKLIAQLILIITLASIALALRATELHIYSDYQLNEAKLIYEPNVTGMYREDLIRQLPISQRKALSDSKLVMPLRGKHPLHFYAQPWNQTITVPVMSIKFLDELTIVWAWFEEKNCDTAYITSYLSSLLGVRDIHLGPMQAFSLPTSVTQNSRVNSLSAKLSKTALYFLLAHEAGHLALNHHPNASGTTSQAQELAADNYALDAMAGVGVMPAGMLHYFMAAYMFEPFPDLVTWEYTEKTIGELTHPLTSTRIHNIANRLMANPMDYAHSERNAQKAAKNVSYVSKQIADIANHIDNGGMKIYSASWLLQHYPKTEFSTVCQP